MAHLYKGDWENLGKKSEMSTSQNAAKKFLRRAQPINRDKEVTLLYKMSIVFIILYCMYCAHMAFYRMTYCRPFPELLKFSVYWIACEWMYSSMTTFQHINLENIPRPSQGWVLRKPVWKRNSQWFVSNYRKGSITNMRALDRSIKKIYKPNLKHPTPPILFIF